MNPKGLWRDPRSGIYYLRRRIPLPLQSAFACGQLYKVSLGTADPRDACGSACKKDPVSGVIGV